MSSISTISSKENLPTVDSDPSTNIKWRTLIHNGVCFPPEYQPKGLDLKINGKSVILTREQEELIYSWAKKKDTHYIKDPIFQKNFLFDLKNLLAEDISKSLTSVDQIDFSEFFKFVEIEKKNKEKEKLELKNLTREERKKISLAKKMRRKNSRIFMEKLLLTIFRSMLQIGWLNLLDYLWVGVNIP